MTPEQERQLRRQMALQEKTLRGRASESPLGPADTRRRAPEAPAPAPRKPEVEPYKPGPPTSAEELGGALDDPNADYRIEVGPDMVPRRVPKNPVPGPQSRAFGDLLTGEDANNLVKIVRHGRLARQMATQTTPTFGDVAEERRAAAAAAPPPAPAGPSPEEQQAQIASIAQSIRFLVDTRTGHFEPLMPDQEDPHVGPHDILMTIGQDPSQPNILAKGKRVTPTALARLGDPKRNIQPSLRPGFQVPPQYAGIAQALGLGGEEKS